jgi:3-hydroxyisobutyrate dehydrogenase-like beta-hydroxyacid dehydrogenase
VRSPRRLNFHAVDGPIFGCDIGAWDDTLAILAGGDEAVVAYFAPLFAHLADPHPPI